MTTRPHDVVDLYLAPVAIELDRRLRAFEGLSEKDIDYHVAVSTNREPGPREDRPRLVLADLTHALETHGWGLDWVPRGLRMSNDDHELVLGIPESLRVYLAP